MPRHFLFPTPLFGISTASHLLPAYEISFMLRRLAPFVAGAFLCIGCEKTPSSIIDHSTTPPFISQVTISPTEINSDTINIGPTRSPEDILPIPVTVVARARVDATQRLVVRFSVRSSDSLLVVALGELKDDGIDIDQNKGDGFFSGKAKFQIRRVQLGSFLIEVSAELDDGSQSNTWIAPLKIYRGNRPATISNLQAPTSVKLGNDTQVLLLTLKVEDPDGQSDVARVVFNSFKPDGSPSGGNPFSMFDDGLPVHGDEKAGDGTFSLAISLPAGTPPGTYRFEFQAFDRSNEPSNIIVHRITITP